MADLYAARFKTILQLIFSLRGDFGNGKKIPHRLAKLYSASFLSWRDKCLSVGDFPKDLVAGCG